MNINQPLSKKISLKPLISGVCEFLYKKIEASEHERGDISARFCLVELEQFFVQITINKTAQSNWFALSGLLEAKVTQKCVVTLEPVQKNINHSFELFLAKENISPKKIPEDQDFEFYYDDAVDIGEISAIELGLALDPYPRKPGVDLSSIDVNLKGIQVFNEQEFELLKKNNIQKPFSVLAELQRKE